MGNRPSPTGTKPSLTTSRRFWMNFNNLKTPPVFSLATRSSPQPMALLLRPTSSLPLVMSRPTVIARATERFLSVILPLISLIYVPCFKTTSPASQMPQIVSTSIR